MAQIISGPGVGLVLPQSLYPSALLNAPLDSPTNRVGLAAGEQLPIPAGDWYISLGCYCILEYLDPVTNIWVMGSTGAWLGGVQYVKSDGFTVRLANRTGCPVSASVTAPGSSYVQATTTITATGSTSTWVPIVGGALTASLAASGFGAGYGIAPLVLIPAPPPAGQNPNGVGGIQATAFATIASGTVSTVSFTNPGAGYTSPFTVVLQPNPTDPNIATGITLATCVFSLTASGSLTGALCTNPGAPITPANITLTVAGAGTNATVTANVLQTVTAGSVIGGATGAFGTVAALLTTVGGFPATGTFTNSPEFNYLAFRPRPAQISLAVTSTNSIAPQVGAIYDGGLFLSAPTGVLAVNPFGGSSSFAQSGTLALTMGSRADFCHIQPAP